MTVVSACGIEGLNSFYCMLKLILLLCLIKKINNVQSGQNNQGIIYCWSLLGMAVRKMDTNSRGPDPDGVSWIHS